MKSIGMIGTGNIGTSLIRLLCKNNSNNFITISNHDPQSANKLSQKYNVDIGDNKETIEISDILFLAVKPGQINEICKEINTYTLKGYKNTLTIISTASGVTVDKIDEWTDKKHTIVRCTPNIPNIIEKGSILWYKHYTDYWDDYYILNQITKGPRNIWLTKEESIDNYDRYFERKYGRKD